MKLRSFLAKSKINFMAFHKTALILSVVSMLASVALIGSKGLNLGIDFAGGILIEARIKDGADVAKIRELISEEIGDVSIQNSGTEDVLIRVAKSGNDQDALVKKVQQIIQRNFSSVEYRKVSYVGPQVGSRLLINGTLALLLSFVFIMLYVWIRFDWQFGLGCIFALLHDAVLTLGFFSLSGLEFNVTSIAAILTIIGYSTNDSVVIYDRIRENITKLKDSTYLQILNSSINSTLSRTVLTAGVTLASLFALIVYGGDSLFSFSCTTFFGIVIGTYSSVYISAPILIYLNPRSKNNHRKTAEEASRKMEVAAKAETNKKTELKPTRKKSR